MENNITELVFILDRSGSMHGLEQDTVDGFNSLIEKQKQLDGQCLVTTYFFNQRSAVMHRRVEAADIQPLTTDSYRVGGRTALMDAIGIGITRIALLQKHDAPEEVPEHTIVVITTDGKENASMLYSSDEVKKLIKQKQDEDGWEFIFLGANIDAVETAGRIGIKRDNAARYIPDKKGTRTNFDAINSAVTTVRRKKPIKKEWKKSIETDYDSRK